MKTSKCTLPPWQEMKVEALRIGLDGCEVFKMLDDETKEREWNGIGSDAMFKWIRNLLDFLYTDALAAACIHDFRFVIGGTEADFHKSNIELKKNLYKCLKFYKDHYSILGYWLTKIKIKIAVYLCEKYGMPGWNLKTEND